jgi:hypothetical protein
MSNDTNKETQELIQRDFGLATTHEALGEDEFFDLLADHVAFMIERNLEELLSLMYRMDINEAMVHRALSPGNPEPANVAIAKLVVERQRQRVETKRQYKQEPLDDLDDELKF